MLVGAGSCHAAAAGGTCREGEDVLGDGASASFVTIAATGACAGSCSCVRGEEGGVAASVALAGEGIGLVVAVVGGEGVVVDEELGADLGLAVVVAAVYPGEDADSFCSSVTEEVAVLAVADGGEACRADECQEFRL